MGIRFTSSRRLSIPPASEGRATGRRTGWCWGVRRAAASGISRTAPTGRSRTCSAIRSRRTSGSASRRSERMQDLRRCLDVNVDDLQQELERKRAALGEEAYAKLRNAVEALRYLEELVADQSVTMAELRRLIVVHG